MHAAPDSGSRLDAPAGVRPGTSPSRREFRAAAVSHAAAAAADLGLRPLARRFTDPVWFFITDWFAIYLVSRGFRLEESLLGFWVPFLAADLGNFFGGGFSSWLITRGWSVGAARKASP